MVVVVGRLARFAALTVVAATALGGCRDGDGGGGGGRIDAAPVDARVFPDADNCGAVVRVFQVEADAMLDPGSPAAPGGALTAIDVDDGAGTVGLFRFTASGLPSAVTLRGGRLRLIYAVGSNECGGPACASCDTIDVIGDVEVYFATTDWVESQVSYNLRATGMPWSSPGADGADRSALLGDGLHLDDQSTTIELGAGVADIDTWRNDADQVTMLVAAGEGTRFVIAARENPAACNGGEPFEPVQLELEYCSEEP